MVVIGDYIYTSGGGFWASTRLLEFKKGENKATRIFPDLKGEFTSGVCQTGEREIMIATCGRSGSTKSYFTFINLDTWEIVKEKQVSADISAEFFDTPGIALAGGLCLFLCRKNQRQPYFTQDMESGGKYHRPDKGCSECQIFKLQCYSRPDKEVSLCCRFG